MRPASPGSSTSAASSCIRIRCAPAISIIPDELRIDLDPTPGVEWADIRRVALEVKALLEELGLTRLAEDQRLARHARQRRASSRAGRSPRCGARRWRCRARSSGALPALATSKWWKEERHGVFLDYNQNAKDRTTCSAYSVRPLPDARVSAPLALGRGPRLRAGRLHRARPCPQRFAAIGDPHAGMDAGRRLARRRCSSSPRATRRRASATRPWPPHFRKMEGEAPRVAPSRAKRPRRSRSRRARRCR